MTIAWLNCSSAWRGKAYIALTALLFALHAPLVPSAAKSAAPIDEKKVRAHNNALLVQSAQVLEGVQPLTFIRGSDYEEFDIFSRAVVAAQVNRVMNLPEPRTAYLNRPALEAVILSDHFGDFAKGDYYASLVAEGHSLADPSMWNYTLNHLRVTGRARQAKLVEDSMRYEFKSYANIPQLFPDLSHSHKLVEEDELLTRHAEAALKARDSADVIHDASTMLQLYKERPVDPFKNGWNVMRRQDLLCTVLDIARRLSDLGFYNDSNNLLNHLEHDCQSKEASKYPAVLIDFERLVNADRSKQDDQKLWSKVQDEIKIRSEGTDETTQRKTVYEYPISESLRMLALAFYNAGEISRAKTLIFRALEQFETRPLIDQPDHKLALHSANGWEGNRILLKLDAAIITAKSELSEEAYALSLEALDGPSLVEARYGFKIAELARLLRANNRIENARRILETAHAKLIDPKRTVPPAIGFLPASRVLVDYTLAKQLIEESEVDKGRTIVEELIAEIVKTDPNREIKSIKDEYQYSSFVLAGDAAASQHDFTTAARRYRQASESRGGQNGFSPSSLEPVVFWLKKALACAEQSPDFPPDELANMYGQCVTLTERDSPGEALKNQTKAVQHFSDSNPEKVAALTKLAAIERALPKPPPTNYASPYWIHRVTEKHVLTPKEKADRLEAHPEIATLKRAALLAEAQKDPKAYQSFIDLAEAEGSIDISPETKVDLEKAITLYPGAPKDGSSAHEPALISTRTARCCLLSQPDRENTIQIMREAVAKVESTDGANSPQCKAQLIALYEVLSVLDDDSEALKTLDRILKFKMTPSSESEIKAWVETRSPSGEFRPSYFMGGQIGKPHLQTALAILTKTLDAQKKSLPKDDAQIFQTKLELANLLSNPALGKSGEAPALYKEVLDFLKKHVSEDKALLLMSKDYLESIGKYKPDPVFPQPNKTKRSKHAPRSLVPSNPDHPSPALRYLP